MKGKMMKNGEKAVVVTTAHKGVFFGYRRKEEGDGKWVVLERARMCVYWSSEVKGVLGLAATGPTKGCRVGPAVPRIRLEDVTAVMEVSEEATAAWEKGPWE